MDNNDTVTVKYGDVMEAGAWLDMCDKYGINEWILLEGLADDDNTIKVSLEDAKSWGLVN